MAAHKCDLLLLIEPFKVEEAICFYTAAFGAVLVDPQTGQEDDHVKLKIGETTLLIGPRSVVTDLVEGSEDEEYDHGIALQKDLGIVLYCNNVVECWNRAEKAGFVRSTTAYDPEQPGQRMTTIYDPFGYVWQVKRSKPDHMSPTSRSAHRLI